MTDINHRRKNRPPVNQRYAESAYNNGYAYPENKKGVKFQQENIDKLKAEYAAKGMVDVIFPKASSGEQRVGRTDYLDKSMHGWGKKSVLADKSIGASIGNDFTDGHRGMARSVKGAKKYVRTRIRFHENAATQELAKSYKEEL